MSFGPSDFDSPPSKKEVQVVKARNLMGENWKNNVTIRETFQVGTKILTYALTQCI